MSSHEPHFLFGNFINLSIKEVTFHPLDYPFEFLPVFQSFWLFVHIKVSLTIIVPPGFGVLCDVDILRMFMLYTVNIDSEWVNNFFKYIAIKNEICFEIFDKICQLFNKMIFFLIILGERLFCYMNMFLNYQYVDGNRSVIWCKSLVWVDMMVVMLLLCSVELSQRKTRFKTKFESWTLLEYLVGKDSVGLEISKQKESAILNKVSL